MTASFKSQADTLPARPALPAPATQESAGDRGIVACYSGPFHRIVFKGAGLSGYNEGRYADDPRRPHSEAHRLQNLKIIEQAVFGGPGGVWNGTHKPRILDIGCGNGDLLEVARSQNIDAVGITLIPEQVEECTKRGLTAYKLNYRDIGPEWTGQFDGVVLKGSIEHFVQPSDVVEGRDRSIYEELFTILNRLLDPRSPAARVCNSTIKYLRRPDPRDIMKNPLSHRFSSDAYHYAWLHHMYRGWHPMLGELAERAKGLFVLEQEEDISEDYQLSTEYCLGVIKRAWSRPRMWKEAFVSFAKYPVSTLTHAWGLYISQSTNWYFRGAAPPTAGKLQTWKRAST